MKYKDKCEELTKIIKKLELEIKLSKADKWSKLKEFVKNTNVGTYAYKCNILDKMKELEQGE